MCTYNEIFHITHHYEDDIKATNYKLYILASHPGETMKSMRTGGWVGEWVSSYYY